MRKVFGTLGLIISASLLGVTACQPGDHQGTQTITPRMDLAPEATERYRELLIGKWYLEQPRSDGTTVRSLSEMTRDGTLQIQFQVIYPNGVISESSEKLIWGISGDIYFTVLRELVYEGVSEPVDPEDPTKYLAYRVLKVTEEAFEYQTIVTGNIFQRQRVPDDFELPRKRRADH